MGGRVRNAPRARRWLIVAALAGLVGAGCVREPGAPVPVPAVPGIDGPGPEGVVAEFLGLVQQDAMTDEELERLISVEQLAAGLQLEVDRNLAPQVRHQQLVEALLVLLQGKGPMRQVLAEGSFVYWGRRWGRRASVEVTQVLSPTMESVVHDVELEVVDGRWKISGFPEHRSEDSPRDRSKENR